MLRRALLLLALVAAAIGAPPARGQDVALTLGITGQSRAYTLAELQALPPATVETAFEAGHGPQRARYTGVPVWALFEQSGLLPAIPRSGRLRRVVTVTGRDGYVVAFGLGELDPQFGDRPALLAWAAEGAPVNGPLRLILPTDHRAGRSVRDVVRISVD